MSDPVRVPAPLETLMRVVAGGAGGADRDQRASTFARGLALGALVGAAIAGSTIWQRRHAGAVTGRSQTDASDPGPPSA